MPDGPIPDHDLLIRIDEKVTGLTESFKNHLKHHWMVTVAAITAILAAIASWVT